jgi:hypothetical protein
MFSWYDRVRGRAVTSRSRSTNNGEKWTLDGRQKHLDFGAAICRLPCD